MSSLRSVIVPPEATATANPSHLQILFLYTPLEAYLNYTIPRKGKSRGNLNCLHNANRYRAGFVKPSVKAHLIYPVPRHGIKNVDLSQAFSGTAHKLALRLH
jgi:hypothetical protein